MPQARYRLVDIQTTPYYHCISRCVRRAFLCGFDRLTGKNFDHRKQWILDRIKHQSSVFAIEVCAYAIMSNHFHLVLRVEAETARQWSFRQVIERWLALYKGPDIARRYLAGEGLSSFEQDALNAQVEVWRARLADLSWYMRCLNETVARMANQEDNCSGRFWEGRFRSQALLDEAALISCMAYVDLNPIRAKMCDTLESSDFTSIQERIRHHKKREKMDGQASWLKPMVHQTSEDKPEPLPLPLADYLALVDWTGRAVRSDKRGAIPEHVEPILQGLEVEQDNWITNTQRFGSRFYRALGRLNELRKLAQRTDQRWIQGHAQASSFYR